MLNKLRVLMTAVLLLTNLPFFTETTNRTETYQVIPDQAIRLRILATSDEPADQAIKHAVRDAVNERITDWVEELTEIDEAREMIQTRLDEIEEIVAETVATYDPSLAYQVDYDSNVLFPAKMYDYYVYPAGEYEAILITLGEGNGSNWWCVLFPPLCFLDFSAGATVSDSTPEEADEEVETEEVTETEVEETPEVKRPKISFFFLEWFR